MVLYLKIAIMALVMSDFLSINLMHWITHHMKTDYAGSILLSLRRIIHSIDQHNKQLGKRYELTVPQLVCLRQLVVDGELTPGTLAKKIFLSQATVTGIIDRLEGKGLVNRIRSVVDRRKVVVRVTEKGKLMANDIPWPLQERFSQELAALQEPEIEQIDAILKRLVVMMEAPLVPVWTLSPRDALAASDEITTIE